MTGVVIVLIVIVVISRQVLPKRVTTLRLFGLPLLAAFEAIHTLLRTEMTGSQIVECIVTMALALIAGLIQTWDTRVEERADGLYYRGGWKYVVTWFALLLARMAAMMIFQGPASISHFQQNEWILYIDVAVAWGARSLLLSLRHPSILTELQHQLRERRRTRDR